MKIGEESRAAWPLRLTLTASSAGHDGTGLETEFQGSKMLVQNEENFSLTNTFTSPSFKAGGSPIQASAGLSFGCKH